MSRKWKLNIRLRRYVAPWLIAALLLWGCPISGAGGVSGASAPVTAILYGETDGAGGLSLCIYPPLSALGGGGAVALVMTLRMPAGWSAGEVACGEGAASMTLTVGEGEDTVKLLLDGVPTVDSPRILTWERCPPWVEFSEVDGIYRRNADGSIEKIPVRAENFSTEDRNDTTPPEADISDPPKESEESESVADAPPVAPRPAPPVGEDIALPILLGCQESAVSEGSFAVRFLFEQEWGAAVVCIRGGGCLRATTHPVSLAEGRFEACTFYGLRGDGDYTFLAYTREGVVTVRYSRGRFLGYG